MLVNLKEVLEDAQKRQYAVGLFNTVNLEMAQGVLAAAEETRSPVIIGTAEILLPYSSLAELAGMLIPMARRTSGPVVLHYDHGLTFEKCMEAMKLGFTSVMYDRSVLPLEQNQADCREMVKIAHAMDITVEAELGHVGANDGDDGSIYTQPDEAARFAEATGVDALAVAIGTAHGAYKEAPKLDFDRLAKLREAVPVPLVLHGGSGLSDEDFRRCVAGGISKVNIFTDINCAALRAAQTSDVSGGITSVMNRIADAVKEETMKKMALFSCTGKA